MDVITFDGMHYVTVELPDGRQLDIYESGAIQVYSADSKQGTEILLPENVDFHEVKVFRLG
ncbi:hypothetical protein GEORGE_79 [Mycobacterium phage George]|uniref:Uncharacterized protein n=1 Tax=Mycobacterium phage George TaxID=2920883 RepID=G1BQC5_9CAUD|nr:hypothetical protein FGG53_gp09 [Mycobacterium phage George]AEK32625.1 hypothetical protein GEORGE_79 [Mycobacterium phage George]